MHVLEDLADMIAITDKSLAQSISEDSPGDNAEPAEQEPAVVGHDANAWVEDYNNDEHEYGSEDDNSGCKKARNFTPRPISDIWTAPDSVFLGLRVYSNGARAVIYGRLAQETKSSFPTHDLLCP